MPTTHTRRQKKNHTPHAPPPHTVPHPHTLIEAQKHIQPPYQTKI